MILKRYIEIKMIIIEIKKPPTVRITTYKASYYNIASREKYRFEVLTLKTVAMHLPAITLSTFDGNKIILKKKKRERRRVWH